MERPQPRRRRREADGAQESRHVLDWQIVREGVEEALVRRPGQFGRVPHGVRPQGAGDGGLAAARRADDEADVPGA